ncbi:MAG: hypothetical protein ACYCZ1_03545 [Candidatus Humimicrobiaceae bacterium]
MKVPETGIYFSINGNYAVKLVENEKIPLSSDKKFQILKLVEIR